MNLFASLHSLGRRSRTLQSTVIARRGISSSQLTIEKVTDKSNFEARPKKEDLTFGTTISDHMLLIEWTREDQWKNPKIVPYGDLKISPAASCLNYGKDWVYI